VTTFKPDQFARWPLYSGIAIFAIVTLAMLWLPLFILLLPIILSAVPVLLIVAIWCGSVALFRGEWRRALSMMAIPLMVVLAVASMGTAISARDELRFLIHRSGYEAIVAEAKVKGKHFAVIDDWSLFVTANGFVVWDERDKPEEVISGFRPYHSFGDHFYLVGDY
jgi:hypothetical protein